MAECPHPSWQEHEVETVQDMEDQEVERDMNEGPGYNFQRHTPSDLLL